MVNQFGRGRATVATYEPTPEDIARGCAEIQKTWTAEDRRRRSAWAHTPAIIFAEMTEKEITGQ
jgi:hypothetical protein